MAAIDKTYVDNYADWKEAYEWAKANPIPFEYEGKILGYESLVDYMYYTDLTPEDFEGVNQHGRKKEYVLWNTPMWIDRFLIKNCPIEWIQDVLKNQYNGGWSKIAFTNMYESTYDLIKSGKSDVDTYKRNGKGNKVKLKLIKHSGINSRTPWKFIHNYPTRRVRKGKWLIDIKDNRPASENGGYWEYHSGFDMWFATKDCAPWTSTSAFAYGNLKSVLRIIRKRWNLPAGLEIHICDFKWKNDYLFITK